MSLRTAVEGNRQTHKISIIGGTLWGNRGAEAMLETAIGEVRKRCPDAEFGIYSYYPTADRALITDSSIQVFSSTPKNLVIRLFPLSLIQGFFGFFGIPLPLPKDLTFLRDSDVLLDIGGITFNDSRLKFLPFNVLTILPAMLMKTPVVKLSQAMGPFRNPINRMVSKFMLSNCKLVFARGAKTAEHLEDLKLNPEQWSIAADVAMSFDEAYALTTENDDKVAALVEQMQSTKRVIAISPSVLIFKKKGEIYLGLLTKLIQSIAKPNTRFVVFPNASRASEEGTHNNDIVAIRELRNFAKKQLETEVFDSIDWVDYDINNASVRRMTADADLLVTSRFHAMISGLVCTTPTLVIGWSHKYLETLAGFDMEATAFNYNAEPQIIFEAAQDMLTRLPEIKAQIAAHLPENQRSSAAQFDRLKEGMSWKN